MMEMYLKQLMFVLVLTATAATDANVTNKLTLLDKRIDFVELRINTDNEQANEMFTTLQQNYEQLNESVHHLKDQKCHQSMDREEKRGKTDINAKDIIEMQTQSQMLVSLGIESEKKWTRDKVGKLTNQLSEHTDLLKRQWSDLSNKIHLQNDQVTKNFSKQNDINDAIIKKSEQMEDQVNMNLKKIEMMLIKQQKEIENLTDILAKINSTLYSIIPTTTHAQTTTPKVTTFNCPTGWISFSSYCYLHVNEKKTFRKARANCESFGASLADLISQTENAFVVEKFRIDFGTWIGYSDEETEGTWVSLRTGQSARFTNFRPGQPDGDTLQNCAIIGYETPFEMWNDWQCYDYWKSICKKNASIST